VSARRRPEADLRTILRFIAEHEGLALTREEFPELPEERLRSMLAGAADLAARASAPKQASLDFALAGSAANGDRSHANERPSRTHEALGHADERPSFVSEQPSGAETQTGNAGKRASHAGAARRVVINTDGASRGNPGIAGAGWVIYDGDGDLMVRGRAFLGKKTNNEAEYEAVIRALAAAAEIGANEVELRADSELLIRQVNGQYQVRNERLAVLHRQVREALRHFRKTEAKHVRREQNGEADALANEAIDTATRQEGR